MITEAVTAALAQVVAKHGEERLLDLLRVAFNDVVHIAKNESGAIALSGTNHVNPSMQEAWRLTHGDRRNAYGTPAQVFAGYAKIWSGLLATKLRTDLDASDVALLMTALKLAREVNARKDDNVVDAHGYLILHDEIKASK